MAWDIGYKIEMQCRCDKSIWDLFIQHDTTDVMWSRNLMSMQHLHTHTHTHTHQQTVLGQDLAHGGKIMLAKIVAKILPKVWQDLGLLPRSCSWQESCPKTFCWDQTPE